MKSLKIFGTVLGLHIILLLNLLFYPGCKTIETQTPIRNRAFTNKEPKPVPVENPESVDANSITSVPVDEDFNDEIGKNPDQKDRYSPQRPPVLLQMEDSSFAGDLEVATSEDAFKKLPDIEDGISKEFNENNPSIEYIVKSGDSLWSITRKFGVATTALAQANGISQNAILQIGQTLKIPQNTSMSAEVQNPLIASLPESNSSNDLSTYTVVSGDSLSLIAKEQGTSITAIRSINQLVGDKILVGQTLLLPNLVNNTENKSPESESENLNQLDASFHTVVSGDRLSKIAQQYKVSLKDLMEWNQLKDPNRIRVGQKLQVSPNNFSEQKQSTIPPKLKTVEDQKNTINNSEKSETSEKKALELTEEVQETELKPIQFEDLLQNPEEDNGSEREVKIIKVE